MKSFTGYMHGVNLGGWLSQCSHSVEHYKSFISEEDIRKIADMGADHVRLPIDFECIETESGEPLPFGYVSISECIEWCEKYELNVILDVHKTAGFSFDSKQNTLFDSEPLKLRYRSLELFARKYYRLMPNTQIVLLKNKF